MAEQIISRKEDEVESGLRKAIEASSYDHALKLQLEEDEAEFGLQEAIKESWYDHARQFQLEKDFVYAAQLQIFENEEDTLQTVEYAYVASSSTTDTQVFSPAGARKVNEEASERNRHASKECGICLEVKESSEIFNNMVCSHNFCSDCILQHISSKLKEKSVPIDCPEPNCSEHLTPQQCQAILPLQTHMEWSLVLVEAGIPISERFYCPFKDCSALLWNDVPKPSTEGLNSILTSEATGTKETECPECRRLFCAQCLVPWHAGSDCSERESLSSSEKEKDDIMFDKLAKEKLWKHCTRCRHIVEKTSGCDHITCRCGYEFCYVCGSEWKGRENPEIPCNCKGWH